MYIDVDVPGGPKEDGAPHWGYVVSAPQRGNRFLLCSPVHVQRSGQGATGAVDGRDSPQSGGGGQDGQQEGESKDDPPPSMGPGGVRTGAERRREQTDHGRGKLRPRAADHAKRRHATMGRVTDRRHKPDREPGWQPGQGLADCGHREQRPWASW